MAIIETINFIREEGGKAFDDSFNSFDKSFYKLNLNLAIDKCLVDLFLHNYPYDYEDNYQRILNRRRMLRDSDYSSISQLFNDYRDYILECLEHI